MDEEDYDNIVIRFINEILDKMCKDEYEMFDIILLTKTKNRACMYLYEYYIEQMLDA